MPHDCLPIVETGLRGRPGLAGRGKESRGVEGEAEQEEGELMDLGSPLFNEYARLLLAAGDAEQEHKRVVLGCEPKDAQLELECQATERQGDVYVFKHSAAQDWLLALRFVEELYPSTTAERLSPIVQRGLDHLEKSLK